jgi:hypothetical protein
MKKHGEREGTHREAKKMIKQRERRRGNYWYAQRRDAHAQRRNDINTSHTNLIHFSFSNPPLNLWVQQIQ